MYAKKTYFFYCGDSIKTLSAKIDEIPPAIEPPKNEQTAPQTHVEGTKIKVISKPSRKRAPNETPGFKHLFKWRGSDKSDRTLRLASKNTFLVLNNNSLSLHLLNLEDYLHQLKQRGNKEFENLLKIVDQSDTVNSKGLIDFRIFGTRSRKIMSLYKNGVVAFFQINARSGSSSFLGTDKIQLKTKVNETASTLAICSKDQYIAIHTKFRMRPSRLLIFKLNHHTLELKDTFDLSSIETSYFSAVTFYKYYGQHLLLTCASCDQPSIVMTFDYNQEIGKVMEINNLRRSVKMRYPQEFKRVSGKLVLVGFHGKICKIEYTL